MATPKLPLSGTAPRKKEKRVIITAEVTPPRLTWAKPPRGNAKRKGEEAGSRKFKFEVEFIRQHEHRINLYHFD
ncbi:hypothetical protein H5410_003724 [Solanum commersonii]|uniref:Uncharacterized protein n=1 Tax=Solanum commersonii TaxID=4109 RepID=A0A9J6B6F8_SOLCO|nr:hypothetical protein H5410_003724 [Solanum commersonii]